jgi:pantoate--beta-alanine ligase
MGFLHQGHLALISRARELADFVVVSIFVNPTQFGPGEDFAEYPRDPARDLELCREQGADLVFSPTVEEMYPDELQTHVTVEELSQPLCGASRPGHFRGVATVVSKLFHIVEPDVAVFGEKDYQQLQVVRRMVRDLNMAVEIEGVKTLREADGLALSSRNAYLSDDERQRALCLVRALDRAQDLVASGEHRPKALAKAARDVVEGAGARVDYAEVRHPETLQAIDTIEPGAVLALAVYVGTTRLIDNRVLTGGGSAAREWSAPRSLANNRPGSWGDL